MTSRAGTTSGAPAIRERLARVRERIAEACRRAGRDPASVRVVAVTKRHPASVVREAARAGITDVGENYAQELRDKRAELSVEIAGTAAAGLSWHFIGRLQTNKVKYVVGRAALIHAVDSAALADAIDRRAAAEGVVQRVLVAVNVAGDEHKSGVPAGEAGSLLDHIGELSNLHCVGLMTMPPLADAPESSRPHFRALVRVAHDLGRAGHPLPELSMGTTGDFDVAVEEGATWVRIGTALFGPRATWPGV